MTRIVTDADRFVPDALRGFALAHAEEVRLVDGGVVRAQPLAPGRTAVLIGGGSGHYPAFAGYVGQGMAAGAVCGNVFTSPSTGQALRVAEAADAGGGILFTFGQYAGDVLHFGEAQRRLRERGIDTRTVLITDDVASAPAGEEDRRRGIAGIVCVFHVAGAAAERGDGIDEVERLARRANERTRTHGVAFAGCTLPGADHPLFEVPEGSMSVGLGIHGEPGVRDEPLQDAAQLAQTLLGPLLAERPDGADRAVVLVNGLGTVKYEDLFALFGHVSDLLAQQGVAVVEPVCGELVTSLDMSGVSLTTMWLDDELEALWRAAAAAPAFRKGAPLPPSSTVAAEPVASEPRPAAPEPGPASDPGPPAPAVVPAESRVAAAVALRLFAAARDAIDAESGRLGDLDAIAGDGDHGVGMLRGIAAATAAADGAGDAAGIEAVLEAAADAWAETAGGTSGALWGAGLQALGASLGAAGSLGPAALAAAIRAARERVQSLGGAELGDKTMLDAIVPFEVAFADAVDAGHDVRDALAAGAVAARAAADATAALSPRLGRARPLAARSIGHPDPGAVSFTVVIDAVERRLGED
ncbi:dihydroxyacetone kinase family protein [Microbacterium insulae]|uniref:Dihydroxyacetone kinase family protein n=1 Tax=Microbacterium insulae TaxID=483014 RepID=A0ABW3AFH8_9MICO